MNPKSVVMEVRREVEKPFQEKLKRSEQLARLFATRPNACVSCSFGKDSMVVLFLALRENPKIPVVFNNTGIEWKETMDLAQNIAEKWGLNYVELRPETNFWAINDRIRKEHLHMDDGRKHSNICCYHLKEKPFKLWRRNHAVVASLTGLTALESRNRMFTACHKGMEYYSSKDDLYKIHPLMFWTEREVWEFTKDNNIPVNEAYAKHGINRIGCMWCMSYRGWRHQVSKINPQVYCYLMRRYFGTPSLLETMKIHNEATQP